MSIGLKRGMVALEPHQEAWDIEGKRICEVIKEVLGDDAIDVQHVGSTSIKSICAKPIIDVAVSVRSFEDIFKHDEELLEKGIVYRKEDIPGQQLYRCGDLDNDVVTHFIHVVIADSDAWHNYINFRDYMNTHEEDAKAYADLKKELCAKYPEDRGSYLEGKSDLVCSILSKAKKWRQEI